MTSVDTPFREDLSERECRGDGYPAGGGFNIDDKVQANTHSVKGYSEKAFAKGDASRDQTPQRLNTQKRSDNFKGKLSEGFTRKRLASSLG